MTTPQEQQRAADGMGAHTPGPWAVDPMFRSDVQAGGKEVCVAFLPDDAGAEFHIAGEMAAQSIYEAFANARLIAAAPELLAVALRARSWIASVMTDEFGWPAERVANPPAGSHLHALDAAIAAATGGAK